MSGLQWATLLGTISILIVSAYHLYLGQIKEHRSEVSIRHQDSFGRNSFAGGSSGQWSGFVPLKVLNSGSKGAFVSDVEREIVELQKDGVSVEPENIELDSNVMEKLGQGDEIEAGRVQKYNDNLKVIADDEYLVEHDVVLIKHILTVEDNQGAYEVSQVSKMDLVGPDHVRGEFGLE